MSKEFKKYGLKPARVNRDLGPVSAVCLFTSRGETTTYTVQFAYALVEAIGKRLPRGVSRSDYAYLHVYQCDEDTFDVWACYLNSGEGKLLWTCKVKPHWLKYSYTPEQKNGNNPQTRASAITTRTNPRRGQRDRDHAEARGAA